MVKSPVPYMNSKLRHEVGLLVRITSTKLGFASLQKHVGFLIKFVKSKISHTFLRAFP
jgi:hypothetical protein